MTRTYGIFVDCAPEIAEVGAAVGIVQAFLNVASSVRLSNDAATRAALVDAICCVTKRAQDNDVVILMFAGHGEPATPQTPWQAWRLHENDRFTDQDLATMLLGLKGKCIVISACCFAEGMFEDGPCKRIESSVIDQLHLPVELTSRARFDAYFNLRMLNEQRVALLEIAHDMSGTKAPMICLSAATYNREVILARLVDFAKLIIKAAGERKNYHDLADEFDAVAYTGHDFHVAARPSGRMDEMVLARTQILEGAT